MAKKIVGKDATEIRGYVEGVVDAVVWPLSHNDPLHHYRDVKRSVLRALLVALIARNGRTGPELLTFAARVLGMGWPTVKKVIEKQDPEASKRRGEVWGLSEMRLTAAVADLSHALSPHRQPDAVLSAAGQLGVANGRLHRASTFAGESLVS